MHKIINRIHKFIKNNDFLKALSKSFLICIPLFVIGSFALLLSNFPINSYKEFLEGLLDGQVKLVLDYITRGTFDVISIAIVLSVCYNYASIKKLNTLTIFSMMVAGTCSYLALVYEPSSKNAFGIANLFTSLVVCAASCNIYLLITKLFNRRKGKIIGNTNYVFQVVINSIWPTVITIGVAALAKVILVAIFDTSDINSIISLPIVLFFKAIKNDFLSGFLYVLIVHIFWMFGIHGSNVLESVVEGNFMIESIGSNIFTKTFNDTFVLMGGCGALLALVIAILIFSKQKSTKKLGAVSLITVPFNINELLVFGLPIVLNPTFFIPFVITPIFCFLSSYLAIYWGLVPMPMTEVNWTTPIIFSGYLATGSVSGAILQVFNLVASVFIYMPFVKKYDKVLETKLADNIKELENVLFNDIKEGREPDLVHEAGEFSGIARLLILEISEGIKEDKFEIYYQGQFDQNQKCYGAEALLRFKYHDKVSIAPPLVIEIAKEGSLIYELEKYLFKKIVEDIKKNELKDLVISFNITMPTLMNDNFEEDVLTIINHDEKIAKLINFELTEESSFNNDDKVIGKIHRLSEKGFLFSIDDFGMGHTSLLYLQTSSFKELKLDGSLVKQLFSLNTNEMIIASIVYLSETIKFDIVAEYVETKEEFEKLKSLKVYRYQGFYFAKPMPYNEFVKALNDNSFWKNES